MPAREINPFTARTRIRSQFSQDTMIDEQSQRVETTIRLRPLSHRGWHQYDKASLRQCIDSGRPLRSLQDRDIILGQLVTFLVNDNVSDAYDQ